MDNDTKKFLSDLLAELQRIDYVRPEDIPNIDLYMDQITTFMDSQLETSKRHPITDKYFGKDGSYSLEDIYREVFGLEHQETQNLMKDLARKFNTSCQTFPDAAPEDAELLRNFSLICMLSYDVYVKKTIIERLIDTTTSDKSKTEKNKK